MSIRNLEELKQKVHAEHRQGRSTRELATDYEPLEMTIRQRVMQFAEHDTKSVSDVCDARCRS